MPLDPTIANPVGIKLNDPLEQYSNFLRAGYLQSEIQKANISNAIMRGKQAAYATPGVFKNGALDPDALGNALIANKVGQEIPAELKNYSELQKNNAEAGMNTHKGEEYTANAVKTMMGSLGDLAKNVDMNDPKAGLSQYQTGLNTIYSHPIVQHGLFNNNTDLLNKSYQGANAAAQAAAAGGPDSWKNFLVGRQEGIKSVLDLQNKQKELALQGQENTYGQVDQGGQKTVFAGKKYGQPSVTNVGTYGVGINPNGPNGMPLGKQIALDSAKEVQGLRDAALNSTRSATNLGYMLKILDQGNAMTGTGAENMNKLLMLAKAAGFNVPQEVTKDTQTLSKYLNENVMDRLAKMPGLSRSTNLKLQQINASSPQLLQDPATIRQLLMNEWKENQNNVGMYNTRAAQVTSALAPNDPARGLLNQLPQIPGYGAGVAKGTNGRNISSESIIQLINNPQMAPMFDKSFGTGSAAHFLGGSQPGAVPFSGGGTASSDGRASGGGGGTYNTSVGPITYNPHAGVDQWMPLVNKLAPLYGVDPQLARIIMDKESGGDPNAHNGTMNKDGSWDHGLMQVNSVHKFTQQQLSDPEFNIRQGLSILAGSMKAHPGDLRSGIKGYNGTGPKADAYAADVLARYMDGK